MRPGTELEKRQPFETVLDYPPRGSMKYYSQLIRDLYPHIAAIGVEENPEKVGMVGGFWRLLWNLLKGRPLVKRERQLGFVRYHVVEFGPHDSYQAGIVRDRIEEERPAGIVIELQFHRYV